MCSTGDVILFVFSQHTLGCDGSQLCSCHRNRDPSPPPCPGSIPGAKGGVFPAKSNLEKQPRSTIAPLSPPTPPRCLFTRRSTNKTAEAKLFLSPEATSWE